MKYKREHFSKTDKEFSLSGISVKIKDSPINGFSAKSAIGRAINLVPKHLRRNVNNILVGQFEPLKSRDFEAMYKNGDIYLTNTHRNEEDMIDDIVHEFAHSAEEEFYDEIYGNGEIEREFKSKRMQLYGRISSNKKLPSIEKKYFADINFNQTFDEFLHNHVGYDILRTMTSDLFFSPYGSTSVREYFANGFEAFFMREQLPRLKNISPFLYKAIENLLNLKGENDV